ncbi:hypothetical protein D9619_010449 [Psilocybe cf. subviscida]|uniref:CCHC-type domain-containing protein n=1 Tax=Psilocybe cf. subviscida TaxID=2480587 RepID=A0A8H5ASA6_9AGAR|nr:hypothetical protein D9619_010449 [Psilocybe cf. subviscida]
MASTDTGIRIPHIERLDGENYHNWKFAVKMVLRNRGCWEVVSGAMKKPGETEKEKVKEWKKLADDGLTIIGLTVDPSQYTYIRDAEDGVEAWSILKGLYEKNTRSTRINLKRQFYNFEHDVNAPMQAYVSGITDLAAKLKAIGMSLTDEDITDVLIFNLNNDFSSIAASLTASKADLKIADVTGALLEEEQRRGGAPKLETAMTAKLNDGRGPWPNVRKGPETARREGYAGTLGCYRCGRTGHIWRFCTAKRTVDNKEIPDDWKSALTKNSDNQKDDKASIAYAVNKSLNDAQVWY